MVRVSRDFFLARCAQPSAQPGPRPWSAPSFPSTQSVSAPPPGGEDAPEPERQPLRSRRTPFASDRTPSASGSALHTDPKLAPCPKDAASEWQPFLQQCSACALSSYVRSTILTRGTLSPFPAEPRQPPLHLVALARKWIRVNPESTKTLSCAWLPRSLGVSPAIQPRDK